jgi:hypothetical protein
MEHQFPILQGTELYVIRVDSSTTRSVIVQYDGCEFRTDYESQKDAPLLQANDVLVVNKHDTPTAGIMVKRRVNQQTDDFCYMLHDFKHEQPCFWNVTRDTASIFERMYQYIIAILALNTREEMLTWQCILVAYCHLEALALELWRLHKGEDRQTFWEKNKLPTFNGAANELCKHDLAPKEVIQILKNVAALRNSVAHKQLLNGMTTYAKYNDAPIFDSQYIEKFFGQPDVHVSGVNEETLEQLLKDVEHARTVLAEAIRNRS